jgi:hypothetical protein
MEMNDILNGLNSCDEDCSDSMSNSCSCGPSFGGPGIGGFPGGIGCNVGQGFNNPCGCGFGSWIWILLILFYCGCGKNFGRIGNDCGCEKKHDCCRSGNYGSGFLSGCSPYLFVLVILFLCNNTFNGCGCAGNNFGCGTSC